MVNLVRLFITIAVIVGCYACSDTHLLRQGGTSTSETGDTIPGTDPNEADAKIDPTGTTSEALGNEPGGIFKSLTDAGRGKGDVRETKTLAFIANEKIDGKQITYGSTTDNRSINMRSNSTEQDYNQTTSSLDTIRLSFTQNGRDATTYTPRETMLTGRQYKGLLDLLIVVDNSDSMEPKNELVKNNLGKLIPKIDNTDWKILMMNSESRSNERSGECRRKITQSNKSAFKRELQAIIDERKAWRENITWQIRKGLAECQGFYKDRSGSVGYRKNEGNWMRKGSVLAVLVITDEDFQCSRCKDNNCNANPLECSEGAPDALPRLKCNSFHCGFGGLEKELSAYRTSDKLAFYAIINNSDRTCQGQNKTCKVVGCNNSYVTNPCYQRKDRRRRDRHNIDEAIELFRREGIYTQKEDIHRNIPNILNKISKNIEGRLKNRFRIRDAEIESVTVKGMNRSDYRRDGNYLIFTGTAPGPNDTIIVRYREITNRNAREYDRTFTLQHTPDPNTVTVRVDGNTLQQSGNWRVSGNIIELLGNVKNITRSGAEIIISYKQRPQDVAKQRVFNLPSYNGFILPNSVRVSKGCGSYYATSGFSFSGTTVTFDSGNEPNHGQRVCFKYTTVKNIYIYIG